MNKKINKGKVTLFKKIQKQSTRNKVLAAGSVCVAAAVIIALLFSGSGVVALAGVSLPEIERIVNNLKDTGRFHITEVVAGDNDGYFGYYIDGQEPGIGNWRNEIADYNTPAERAAFVDGLRGILDAAGMLGAAPDGGPITWLGDYNESLPWEDHTGQLPLRLRDYEVAELPGEMVPDDDGSYIANYHYEPVEQGDDEETSYLQGIRLEYVTVDAGSGLPTSAEWYFTGSRGLKFSPTPIKWEIDYEYEYVYEYVYVYENVYQYEYEYENVYQYEYEYEDVYERDEFGEIVIGDDGEPVVIGTQVKTDDEGNPIILLDDNGEPVIALDDDGEPIIIGTQVKTDDEGNPVLLLDDDGEPVIALDDDGEPIVIGTQVKTDEDGNPVILLDDDGEPVMQIAIDPDTNQPKQVLVIDPDTGLPIVKGVYPYYTDDSGNHIRVPDYTPFYADEDEEGNTDGIYKYIATYRAEPVEEKDDYYYVVIDYGLASDVTNPDAGDYAAVSYTGYGDSSEAAVDGARFKRVPVSYTYAGAGEGDFRYVHSNDPEADKIDIFYDIVYYSGGFQNNNWFLRHVFNRDDDDLDDYAGKIIVTSVRDTALSDNNIVNADLIVLTAGISLSESNATAIFNASTESGGYKPVMFPGSLGQSAGYEGILARALANKPTNQAPVPAGALPVYDSIAHDNAVNDNVFWTVRHANELLEEYPYISPIGFEDVKQEIDNENFYRAQQNIDLLDEIIHNGTAIRYIINFSGKRDIPPLEVINVLEIQGGLTYPHTDPNANRYPSDITEDKIRQWIGDPDGDAVKTINITQMTTYEFVGKIEDLNDEYHMIYIGGTARGMNESDGESRYNDQNMDGMVYTNIGDLYRITSGRGAGRTVMGGLLSTSEDSNGWYRLPGNDITPTKMQDILDFADAGYPVIIDDRLIDIAGQARIQVTGGSINDFTFRATAPEGSEFNWYRVSGTETVTVSTEDEFTRPANDTTLPGSVGTVHNFYCRITYNGQSITIGPLRLQLEVQITPGAPRMPTSPCPNCGNIAWEGQAGNWFQCTGRTMQPGYPAIGPNPSWCGLQFDGLLTPETMNNSNNNWTPGLFQIPADAFSPETSTIIGTANPSIAAGRFTVDGSYTDRVNENRVDNCSYMFTTLDAIYSKPNVYTSSAALESPDNVRRYLNLSKPVIDLHSAPTPYDWTGGVMNSNDGGNILRYEFTISNSSEAVPHLTTYDIELFLDLNGDGRYTGIEKQNDIVVRRVSDNAVQSRDGSGRYTLEADVRYVVTKQMPEGAVGLFDWSLKATKNDHLYPEKRNIRVSESGLTRIAPGANEITTINILQIASSTHRMGGTDFYPDFNYKGNNQRVNLEWQQRTISSSVANSSSFSGGSASTYLLGDDGEYYEGIYGKLIADVEDFNIKIYTVYGNELNDNGIGITLRSNSGSTALTYGRPEGAETAIEEYLESCDLSMDSSLQEIFMSFDMLIIGFDDAYGGIERAGAEAIDYYINVGNKPVLFAHDTVSHAITTDRLDGRNMWPVLRDAAKQDRYGITNLGMYNGLRGPVQANGYRQYNGSQLSGDNISSLLYQNPSTDNVPNNYSVAWEPGSNKQRTVQQAQGFSSHLLKWWSAGNVAGNGMAYNTFMNLTWGYENNWGNDPSLVGGPWNQWDLQRETTSIRQLNEGKITTYPYYINFEGTRNVGTTHAQWYTLNMNLDDIVVWYCLDSNNYVRNDAANSFYIYNAGNITYTGAGHSMNQSNTTGRSTGNGSPHPQRGRDNPFADGDYSATLTNSHNTIGSASSESITGSIFWEAQLFVNTMIAAYRAAPEPPDVLALDASGANIRYRLLPADDVVLAAEMSADSDNLTVYFRLRDGNLHADKSITLSLTCASGNHYIHPKSPGFPGPQGPLDVDGTQTINAEDLRVIEVGSSNTSNRNGSLLSGVLYKFEIPASVIDSLNSNGRDSEVTIRLEIRTTNVPAPYDLVGYADVVVRRIELFNLG